MQQLVVSKTKLSLLLNPVTQTKWHKEHL
jgi:hypothetical protein